MKKRNTIRHKKNSNEVLGGYRQPDWATIKETESILKKCHQI